MWRDGEPVEIAIDDIVVGDAVILEAGDRVPADGVLLEGELKLDQSALNGESEEAKKLPAAAGFAWGKKIDFLAEERVYRGT